MPDPVKQSQSQAASSAAAPSLTAGYQPLPGRFDEMRADPSARHWKTLVKHLDSLGPKGLNTSWRRGQELLRENGIAHNLPADSDHGDRRWPLDPIPLLLDESEWSFLAAGLIQRARLWDRILHDCYGPRELLSGRRIPPSVLFSQPGYSRPLRHLRNPGKPMLGLYAADLARRPDGSWVVLADRTEAPNGTGFALENRIVLNDVFPGTTKHLNLIRLANYFQEYRDSLFALIPPAIENPHIVLLSPGPGDRTYFEDAFLSRYLGITLAVGEELTVRNDRLYLKTVSGLRPVHVLVRRVPENDVDPLETPTLSGNGVPGLFQAMRSGSVLVVNPPGTGIAEAPAFLPFLPEICRDLLGEELALPSIDTHWTGLDATPPAWFGNEPAVVKHAFSRSTFPPIRTRELTPAALAELRREMTHHPGRHVIQREMPFASAPGWDGDSFEARSVAVRMFLFADREGNYRVMPGGLARCSSSPDGLPGLSLHEDALSKDLWVLSPEPRPSLAQSNLPSRQTLRRGHGILPSRAADNMLWIGRYSERAECATRVLLEIVHCLMAETDEAGAPGIPPLLRNLAKLDYLPPNKLPPAGSDREQLLQSLLPLFFEKPGQPGTGPDTVPANLSRLASLAALSRDRLSNETWRIIRSLEDLGRESRPWSLSGFRSTLQRAILLHSAFNGTSRENLTRTDGWRFLNIGRKLERSTWLLSLVEEVLGLYPKLSPSVLDSALSVNDCILTYRFRYHGPPQVLPALDLLLFDPDNPRGLAFQLGELNRDLSQLPPPAEPGMLRPPHRTILKARNYLATEVLEARDSATEARLIKSVKRFVAELRAELPDVSEQLGWEFFTHVTFTRS